MSRIYIRAHPESPLGRNYTKADQGGWELVTFIPMNGLQYPIFRETFSRWILRKITRRKPMIRPD